MSNKKNYKSDLDYQELEYFSAKVKWGELVELIVRVYVESGIGELKVPVESMIRVYFLQYAFDLNASEATLALSRIDVLKTFALIDQQTDVLPDEESIQAFTQLLAQKDLMVKVKAVFDLYLLEDIPN